MRIRLFFVLATLFTVPAFAQGICAGGITDPYFAPQFAPNNVDPLGNGAIRVLLKQLLAPDQRWGPWPQHYRDTDGA